VPPADADFQPLMALQILAALIHIFIAARNPMLSLSKFFISVIASKLC
jgi:hypothetical protein